jgi:hypothetical protein
MRAKPVRNGSRDSDGRVSESIPFSRSIGIDNIYEDERIKVVSYEGSHEIGLTSCSSVTFAEICKLWLELYEREGKLK